MTLRILGAGGHAKVALEAWRSGGGTVKALHDDRVEVRGREILGVTIVGPLDEAIASGDSLHIAIGDNEARRRVGDGLDDKRCPAVIHVGARLSPSAAIGAGTLVCMGAVVQAEAEIGRHVIVNTLALIEHDVVIGDFAHIAPGVRMGGSVRIGAGAMIGIGAVLLPGIQVGIGAVIGAGTVVIRDVPASSVVAGNPARTITSR